MTYWIFPWNKAVYNLPRCLKEFGFVEWRQKHNVAVGDIVFIYCSSPVRQIKYMMEVTEINIPYSAICKDEHLYFGNSPLKHTEFYTRLNPIAEAKDGNSELSYKRLHELGLKSQLQGAIHVPDNLLPHLISNFDVEFDDLSQTFTEGSAHRTSIITYERDHDAREACLARYGHTCQICGFNFEQTYGPIGKDFIHVHHIRFISDAGGTSHEINPTTDLIPVCPNCHAMLHRKLNGQYPTPAQLKTLLTQ